MTMRLEALREELVRLHAELPRYGLVVWTGGNVSARSGQGQRSRPADAVARSGDDGDAVGEDHGRPRIPQLGRGVRIAFRDARRYSALRT